MIKNSYGKKFSLAEIVYRIICNETEGFTDYQRLTFKTNDGKDVTNDLSLLELDSIHSAKLADIPSCFSIKCDGPVGTVTSLLQDLGELYSRNRHETFFRNQKEHDNLNNPIIMHSSVHQIDLKQLVKLQPDEALDRFNRALSQAKGCFVVVTNLQAINEVEQFSAGQNKVKMTPAFLRAGLIRAMQKTNPDISIALVGNDTDLRAFRQASVIDDFYEMIFEGYKTRPYEVFTVLQHFIKSPEDRATAIAGMRGVGGYNQQEIFSDLKGFLKPLLISEPKSEELVKQRLAIPDFIGNDMAFYTMSLFDENDFSLTKAARERFISYLVELSFYYGGRGYGQEVSNNQNKKETEIFASEVILCALERIFDDMEGDGEIIDLYNALIRQGSALEPIRRQIIEDDVHNAVKSLRGLNLYGRQMFPFAPTRRKTNSKTPKL